MFSCKMRSVAVIGSKAKREGSEWSHNLARHYATNIETPRVAHGAGREVIGSKFATGTVFGYGMYMMDRKDGMNDCQPLNKPCLVYKSGACSLDEKNTIALVVVAVKQLVLENQTCKHSVFHALSSLCSCRNSI